MSAGTITFGFNCKLYRDTADDPDAPTWAEITEVSDVTVDAGSVEVDASIRESGGYEITEQSMHQITINATLEWRNGNANCEALYTAFLARTAINIWVLTGVRAVATSRGFKGDFKITKFPINQDLKELTKVALVLKPCRSTRANYVASANGAP